MAAAKRQIEGYLYRQGYQTYLTDKMPVWEKGDVTIADGADSTSLCSTLQKILGLPRELERNEIVKIVLTVDNIQLMEYEIKTTFKRFTTITKDVKKDKPKKKPNITRR